MEAGKLAMDEIAYRFKTVRQVLEYYMENHGFFTEKWENLSHMTNVFITVMGKKKCADLRPEHFIAYISGRRSGRFGKRKVTSMGTIDLEFRHLKAAMNFCVKARVLNPAHVPHFPAVDIPPPRDRWLDRKELEILMKAIEDETRPTRLRTFVMIARYTAARARAIETLKWDQINFDTGMIEFGKHLKKKTKKRKPTVPMHPELRLYLERLQRDSNYEYVMEHPGRIYEAMVALALRTGLKGLTPHVLRHTWATHASMNNVSMTEIARVMGITVANAERVYAKYQPEYLRGAIEQAVL
jgi:integrase